MGSKDQGVVAGRLLQGGLEALLTDIGPCKVAERCEVDCCVGGETEDERSKKWAFAAVFCVANANPQTTNFPNSRRGDALGATCA
jgi:hypothetical protein